MTEVKYYQNFSPTIMETNVPERFLNIVNRVGDKVLTSDEKSEQYDFSGSLVGKVSKEVQIPVTNANESRFLLKTIKQACVTYLMEMIKNNRAYGWNKLCRGLDNPNISPQLENINVAQTWIVSQYKNEYNPWHKHSGDFSGVIYLKLPENMNKAYEKEFKDHYPASGLIEFMYGEANDFRSDTLKFKPEVGKFILFPSWLRHTVYPFYCEGERRSMSFNAYYTI